MAARKKIVSLADAKRYMNISTSNTAKDRLTDDLVDHASVLVVNELGTRVIQSDYVKEYHDGDGSTTIWLENYPVTNVERVAIGRITVATITYSGTASHASVEVDKTKVRIRQTVSGVKTTSDLALSDYVTISDLDTVINAYTGWTMLTTSVYSTWPSAELVLMPANNADEATVGLDVPDSSMGSRGAVGDYELYGSEGYLYHAAGWPEGYKNICCDYTAGYVVGEIPEGIRSATLELAKLLYDLASKDGTLRSEKIGDYAYTTADRLGAVFSGTGQESVSNMVAMKLAKYRRRILMA